jgi:hypothetical protein
VHQESERALADAESGAQGRRLTNEAFEGLVRDVARHQPTGLAPEVREAMVRARAAGPVRAAGRAQGRAPAPAPGQGPALVRVPGRDPYRARNLSLTPEVAMATVMAVSSRTTATTICRFHAGWRHAPDHGSHLVGPELEPGDPYEGRAPSIDSGPQLVPRRS